jgi:hypothetical protein
VSDFLAQKIKDLFLEFVAFGVSTQSFFIQIGLKRKTFC